MPLLLLVLLGEVLSGVCVPGDGSGKYKGSWRWKGDRSQVELSVALSEFIIYADTRVHGCWEERGCSNEQRAAVDSGHCCCPRAFGCWLMELFGMPPLLDAE
ncbi:hypothetical protein PAMP_018373 [Pampus punctatissimus]